MTNKNGREHPSKSVKTAEEIDDLLTHPSHKGLFEFWNKAREQNLIPTATQIDPAGIPHLLKDIAIFDVLDNTEVRYRLAGTSVAERMGIDPTGQNVIEMVRPDNREFVSGLFGAIINQPVGLLVEYENVYQRGKRTVVNSLYLPLGRTDSTSPRILSTHVQRETIAYEEAQSSTSIATEITKIIWIDIGAGVPTPS